MLIKCMFLSVLAPAVSIFLNANNSSVYQGTEMIIRCIASVSYAVDTEFDVIITWSTNPTEVMDRQYLTVTETNFSEIEYTSTIIISPVDTTDSATYMCTASIIPIGPDTDLDNIIPSLENSDTLIITVEGI